MKLSTLPKFTIAIAAISLLTPTIDVRADHHRDGKAANALGKALAELNQNADSVADQAEKARQISAAELASSQRVLAEARKVLASAEKAEVDAMARLKVAEANVREVEAVRNAIQQANETAKKHLDPKKKAPAKSPAETKGKAQPQKPKPEAKKADPAPAKQKAPAAKS